MVIGRNTIYRNQLAFLIGLISLFIINLSFGAPATIRTGDIISITVANHPEFTRNVEVLQDGTTEYPLLAGIPIEGLTANEVKDLLRPVLIRYDLELEIFINISRERVLKLQVFGEIRNPHEFDIVGELNLQQVLVMAGGPTELGDISRIKIFRIEEGNRSELEINLYDYFRLDSLVIPPEVHDGDIIVIPRMDPKYSVKIIGSVGNPGMYIPYQDENVLDLIEKAGGFTEEADQKRVICMLRRNGKTEKKVVNVRKAINKNRYDILPLMQPDDIIIVRDVREITDFWYWVRNLRELLWLITASYTVARLWNWI